MNVTELSDDMHFTCPFHVTTNQIEDELVALNLETSFYYGVDGIGTEIWRLLIDEKIDFQSMITSRVGGKTLIQFLAPKDDGLSLWQAARRVRRG